MGVFQQFAILVDPRGVPVNVFLYINVNIYIYMMIHVYIYIHHLERIDGSPLPLVLVYHIPLQIAIFQLGVAIAIDPFTTRCINI